MIHCTINILQMKTLIVTYMALSYLLTLFWSLTAAAYLRASLLRVVPIAVAMKKSPSIRYFLKNRHQVASQSQ